MLRAISVVIVVMLGWSVLHAATIQTMDGRTLDEVTILERSATSISFAMRMGGSKTTITLPMRVVHRLRASDGGSWEVINAKPEPEPPSPPKEPEPEPEPEPPPPPKPTGPRGFRGDWSGVFAADMQPPTDWSGGQNVGWKTPLPAWSSGSPTVVGDTVICCAEPHTVLCIDRADGSIRWQVANPPSELLGEGTEDPGLRGPKDLRGWTMATPATDGVHIWITFGQGMMACFDLEGNRLWAVPVNTGSRWGPGLSASPLLYGNLIMQQTGRGLVALDKRNGQQVWKGASSSHLLGTGTFMELGGKMHVVSPEGHLVRIEDGETLCGKVVEKPLQNWGPSAVVASDVAYLHMHERDGNKNSTCVRAYRYQPDGSHEMLWEFIPEAEPKYATRMGNSPLVVDGLYYAVTDGGHLTVVDIETGDLVYEHNWSKHAYASMAKAGPYIYATGRETMHVFKPGRTYEPVADFPHGFARHEGGRSTIIPSPVFYDGSLYVRDRTHLWRIDGPGVTGG
jgi:outer membrane protein assembly factor BamB